MAKKTATKTATTPAPAEESISTVDEPQAKTPEKAAPAAKATEKPGDDQSANGSVGIADIKKAVTFANSVGGLEKAIALLQIVKVAKDVQ
jgi:hypothetical protein